MLKKILLTFILFLSYFWFFNLSYSAKEVLFLENNFSSSNRAWELEIEKKWDQGIRDFIWWIWTKILAPIVFLIWLLIAFIGFYKLFFSDKEDERKKALNYVVYWVIWVILSIAWPFLANSLVWDAWTTGILWSKSLQWWNIAYKLYNQVIIKFFSLFIYLVILIVFVILVMNAIKLIATPDKEDTAKHAKTIVIWNSIWLIVMLLAKNIVELFYKKTSYSWMDTWGAILEKNNFYWIYWLLNYLLAFLGFAITVLVIYQAFLLLTRPDDEATYKNLKKYFVYAILWLLIIGWVYLIANFFIIREKV